MQFIHIKNLEKYHPNYKDRELIWCKVYFSMMNGDPEFELLCEVDQWRFVKFIMLEIQSKNPVPIDSTYLSRKGFDLKKRPILATLQMLHKFVEVSNETVTQSRVEKSREEEEKELRTKFFKKPSNQELTDKFVEGGLDAASALVEASKFLNHYESVGWVVGKARKPMKSWPGAVATWLQNRKDWSKDSTGALKPVKKEQKPNSDCDACGGTGRLPDGVKCWCWK